MYALNLLRVVFVYILYINTAFASSIVTVATGSTSGLYYPSGGAICRLYNLSKEGNTKCIVESTPGSLYNLNAVEGGLNNFAFVQADEMLSYIDKKKKEGNASGIQVVFPLYTEAFVLVASKNSGIANINDIKGKSINIGVENSGVRNFTSKFIDAMHLKSTDFKSIATENQSSVEHMLCSGVVDVSFFISGQPSEMIQNLVENCGAKIIPFTNNVIENILKQNPYYTVVKIPSEMYVGHNFEIQTIGTKAILITSSFANEELVYNLANVIIKNFEAFKQYSSVTNKMSVEEVGIPLPYLQFHSGAIKALNENGIKNNF